MLTNSFKLCLGSDFDWVKDLDMSIEVNNFNYLNIKPTLINVWNLFDSLCKLFVDVETCLNSSVFRKLF